MPSGDETLIDRIADRALSRYIGLAEKDEDQTTGRIVGALVAQGSIRGAVHFLIQIYGHKQTWEMLQAMSDAVMEHEQDWRRRDGY